MDIVITVVVAWLLIGLAIGGGIYAVVASRKP